MNPLAQQLADLKLALQDLESAVQQPRDERDSVNLVLERFPTVLLRFHEIIRNGLLSNGVRANEAHEVFNEGFKRGWLKGELSLWLRLISDYQQLKEEDTHGARARAVAQDVRACSCMLWETYELLTARFRLQTQVKQATKVTSPTPLQRYAAQTA